MKKKKKKKKPAVGKGLYRDGNRLVIREGARFPGRCAICNKECDGEPVPFVFSREKSRYIEVAAAQTVGYAVADLVKGGKYTGPVRAEIPLCTWHRYRRLWRIGLGLGMGLAGGGFVLIRYQIGGADEFDPLRISIFTVIAILVAFVGIVIAWTALVDSWKLWFTAAKYYDRFVWVDGAGRAFLAGLPELEEHHYNPNADNPNLSAEELIRRAGLEDEDD